MKSWLRNTAAETKAMLKLFLQQCKKRTSGPVRVGFLCQYVPAWNKAEPVYRAMLEDERFQPVLICVPSAIRDHSLADPESMDNDTYDYYTTRGYQAVNALIGKNQWLDITAMGLDVLICQRPYDYYLPLCYHSGILAKHMKLCFIPYAILLTREEIPVGLDPTFMRNVWCCFAETEDLAGANRRNHPLAHLLGVQKSVDAGIVSTAQVLKEQAVPCDSWDFSESRFRILWTPRWTSDPNLGGTGFFSYKDWLLDYTENTPDTCCLLRPHPMAFDHFMQTGEMTPEEVAAYKTRIAAMPNAQMDTRQDYLGTMWGSSVLVGDLSSVLPEYFLMDKPLIFCMTKMNLTFTDFFEKMLQGCYVVHNAAQLESVLDGLRRGEDPKKQLRSQLIREIFRTPADTVKIVLDVIFKGVRP